MNLQGQIALVTGATRGIGQGIALELGKQGAVVIGTATTEKGAQAISGYLASAGINGGGMAMNVNDSAQIDQVHGDIRKQFGIKSGEPVIIEDRNGELVLKPATVLAVEMYSPEQVAEWDAQDQLSDAKRKAVLNRLPKRTPKVAKKRS